MSLTGPVSVSLFGKLVSNGDSGEEETVHQGLA